METREGWLREAIERGATQASLAAEAGVSQATLRRWLGDLGLRTKGARARIAVEQLERDAVLRECPRHGLAVFRPRPDGGFRCLRCRSEAVVRRRRFVKRQLVAEAGGACELCGYNQYVGALAFHHRNPDGKQFAVSNAGVGRSIERARAEAAKCVLLCHNCHAEVEAGIATIEADSMINAVSARRDPG